MATIVTRAGKGSPLTHDEVDDNFDNLNTDKVETSAIGTAAAANTGDFATAAQGTLADSALQDITGESIEDLSDVASMTPSDGQALVYGSGVWSAADMAGGIAYTRHTANVTMAANEGVIADTSNGAFTVTLPATPATGDTVVITDGGDWATTNLTVGRNGSTIEGDAADMTMNIGGVAVQFTYDGTTWQIYTQLGAAGGNVVSEGDSPTFSGLTTTGDVSFGDNDKAIFGAGSDLEIYHDGTASVIQDVGTGPLVVRGTDLYLRSAGNSNRLYAGTDTRLYYDGSEKIRTTTTGIDVTGTVTATAFAGDGSALTGVGGSTTYGDVGTYALLWASTNATRLPGATIAGSSLYPANTLTGTSTSGDYTGAGSVSGTWRLMGQTGYYQSTITLSRRDLMVSVWVRIS